MVGNVTWVEETDWFSFAYAGFGVVGFGLWAADLWLEWPRGGEPVWTHWFGAVFWTAFGLSVAFAAVYQLWITDGETNWYVVAITPVLALLMFWGAYQEARKARAR